MTRASRALRELRLAEWNIETLEANKFYWILCREQKLLYLRLVFSAILVVKSIPAEVWTVPPFAVAELLFFQCKMLKK